MSFVRSRRFEAHCISRSSAFRVLRHFAAALRTDVHEGLCHIACAGTPIKPIGMTPTDALLFTSVSSAVDNVRQILRLVSDTNINNHPESNHLRTEVRPNLQTKCRAIVTGINTIPTNSRVAG